MLYHLLKSNNFNIINHLRQGESLSKAVSKVEIRKSIAHNSVCNALGTLLFHFLKVAWEKIQDTKSSIRWNQNWFQGALFQVSLQNITSILEDLLKDYDKTERPSYKDGIVVK